MSTSATLWTLVVLICLGFALIVVDRVVANRFRFTTTAILALVVLDAVATIAVLMLAGEVL